MSEISPVRRQAMQSLGGRMLPELGKRRRPVARGGTGRRLAPVRACSLGQATVAQSHLNLSGAR